MKKSIARGIVTVASVASAIGAFADIYVSEFQSKYNTADRYIFTQQVTGTDYVWCGNTEGAFDADDAWCVWESSEVDGVYTNGILQTADYFRTADAANQKARLRIESGLYTFPYARFGEKGGTSHVIMNGGTLTAATGDIHVGFNGGTSNLIISNGTMRAAYWLTAGRNAATTSRIEVHGGNLTTAYREGVEQTGNTGNGMIDLASYAGSTAAFLQTGGRVHAAGSANKADSTVAMAVGNNASASATVELTGGEMDLDGVLQVPRAGTGVFTMGGGTLDTMGAHIAATSGSTGTMTVTNGTFHSVEDIAIGSGDSATLNISGSGVVKCHGVNDAAKWVILGHSGSGDSEINLDEGGELQAWHIERFTTAGIAAVNFNGGTLTCLNTGNNDWTLATLIGNVDSTHTAQPTVTIGEKGGTIDVGSQFDNVVSAPVIGVGTLTKKGSSSLTFNGSYFGGLKVTEGSATTPGNSSLAVDDGEIFLASGANGTVPAATLDDKTLWVEENGHVTLSGVTLDFSSATEQKLFDVTSFKLLGTTVSAETDVSGYFSIADAAVPHKVIYKSDGLYAVYNPTENVWIGGAEGVWSEASNWSEGVIPSETSLVAFTNDTVITCSGSGTAKHWLKLRLADATLELKNADDSTYPGWELGADSIEGNGTIVLTHCGFYATADVTIPDTISLVIKNSGTIENGNDCWLTAADGSTLTVAGSVAVTNFMLTNGSVVFGGDVSVADGARVYIASGTTTFNGALACAGTAILEKLAEASVAKGEDSTFTAPTAGYFHVDAAIASLYGVNTTTNRWIGGESGYWSERTDWNYGIPVEGQKLFFGADSTVMVAGSATVGSIELENSAEVLLESTDFKNVHPTIFLDCVDGSGTVRLSHVGFEGNGTSNRIGSETDNALTLEFVSTTTDSWVKNINVYAPITGEGYIRIYAGTMLYGDNSAFAGTVQKDDVDARFMTPESGFPNASAVTITGTIWLWFTEGEIAFGGNFTAYTTGNCGINLPGGVTGVTLTVGGGDGTVIMSRGWNKNWHPYYSAFVDDNGWQQGTDKFTLRKIGSGAIAEFGFDSVYNLSLEGGSINLGASDVHTGEDTILTVTNATLGIAAATTLASADFKSGSTLKSTYYETVVDETTTYGVNPLTVTNGATLDGLVLDSAGTDPNMNTVYTVISGSNISGTAKVGFADPDTSDNKRWRTRVYSDKVDLAYLWHGFLINIR